MMAVKSGHLAMGATGARLNLSWVARGMDAKCHLATLSTGIRRVCVLVWLGDKTTGF